MTTAEIPSVRFEWPDMMGWIRCYNQQEMIPSVGRSVLRRESDFSKGMSISTGKI